MSSFGPFPLITKLVNEVLVLCKSNPNYQVRNININRITTTTTTRNGKNRFLNTDQYLYRRVIRANRTALKFMSMSRSSELLESKENDSQLRIRQFINPDYCRSGSSRMTGDVNHMQLLGRACTCNYFSRFGFLVKLNTKKLMNLERFNRDSTFRGILINKNVKRYLYYKNVKDQVKERVEKFKEISKHENIYTIPNLLGITRIALAPYISYLIVQQSYGPAVGLFVFAGITDLLDGYIARNFAGQSSVAGSFLDPVADKILVGSLFLALTYVELIPLWLTVLIIMRDISLIMAGFYIRYKSLEPPRTLSRYFDLAHPTALLAPTEISKINTFVQFSLVATTLISTILPFDVHTFLYASCIITGSTTIGSWLSYLLEYDKSVKFLRKSPVAEKEEKER